MKRPIDPIALRLANLIGEDKKVSPASLGIAPAEGGLKVSPFEDVLSKAIEALDGISKQDIRANQLIESYIKGEVEISDVMIATSKLSVMVQLAVTTVNLAVTTFKEITQMQV